MTTKKRQHRVQSRPVTAPCQYPCDCPPHTFEYVKTTKPQLYCERHRVGYDITDALGGVIGHHGGERLVRVIKDADGKVIGRRLVVEKQVLTYEFVGGEAVRGGGPTVNGELYRESKRLGIRGFFERLYHWRQVERIEGDGLIATINTLVTGRNGKPRWDPTLWRELTTQEREVGTGGLSLTMGMGESEEGEPLTMLDIIDPEADLAEGAPPIAQAPYRGFVTPEWRGIVEGEKVHIPGSQRRGLVAYLKALLRGDRDRMQYIDPHGELAAEARNILIEAQSRVALLQADPRAEEALLAALLRVSAVQNNENGTSHTTKGPE